MASSAVQKFMHYNSLSLSDGTTATALSYSLTQWDGTVSWTDPLDEELLAYNQRTISGVYKGKAQPITGSFTINAVDFTDASPDETLLDVVYASSAFAAAVSTATSAFSNFKLWDIAFTMEGTDFGDGADHVATFNDCRLHGVSFAAGSPNTITVSFTCYSGVTRTGPS